MPNDPQVTQEAAGPADPATGRLIALDWGTSSLRAWLLDADGAVADERTSGQGIMQVENGDFAAVFEATVGDWLDTYGALPAVACGMIGSRGGWVEAPYVDTPADPSGLAAQLVSIDAGRTTLHVVPGVMQSPGADRLADVMRGEETQILGVLSEHRALTEASWLVLPGTHCKWAAIRSGRLEAFTTYMTGELFAVLRDHSILGRPAGETTPPDDEQAFALGVTTARDTGAASASAALFSARARWLAGEIAAPVTLSYLSGLLIGEELRSTFARDARTGPIGLIGDAALCDRYRRAMALFDIDDPVHIADAARHGLWRIAGAAGLISGVTDR